MPWNRVDVDEQRIAFVIRDARGKEPMKQLCAEFGISRPTGYLWRNRYRESGNLAGVRERSRRPKRSPQQTSAEIEQRVVELRQQYSWGAPKLQLLLAREGLQVPERTVHRILKRHGLVAVEDGHPPLRQRFEREAPNQLWQMDGKGKYKLEQGACYPLSILDDHSRYLVGLYALRAFQSQGIHECLVKTFEQQGLPEAMLMDRGTQWWSTSSEHGLTWLSVALIKQGIQLIYGRPHHPQTQGKVERFHRTLDLAVRHRGKPHQWEQWPALLSDIRQEYNQVRPHEALQMQTPASRYRRSSREYQPQPAAWEYGVGAEVRQLNPAGCLWAEGRQWFVCEALAGERVQVERMPGKLVIRYRQMYIREIDTQGGWTAPFVVPIGAEPG
jgi:transposase InsO family protein